MQNLIFIAQPHKAESSPGASTGSSQLWGGARVSCGSSQQGPAPISARIGHSFPKNLCSHPLQAGMSLWGAAGATPGSLLWLKGQRNHQTPGAKLRGGEQQLRIHPGGNGHNLRGVWGG